MKALKKVIKENHYDVVHINQNSASMAMDMFVCKQCKVKTIIGHSHNTKCNVLWQHYLFRPFVNMLCNYRFACSKDAGKWVFGKRKDVTVYNNAINSSEYAFNEATREEFRTKFNLNDKYVIGFVGRLQKQKNLFRVLSIFAEVRKKDDNSVLVLVGDGSQRKELEQFVRENNLDDSVRFLGRRDDVAKLMSMFDVFFLPSLYEGLGVVAVEAQASGLRCVVSDKVPAPNLNGNVEYLSLDLPDEKWAECLLMKPYVDRKLASEQIKKGNYDITIEAIKLQDFYLGL